MKKKILLFFLNCFLFSSFQIFGIASNSKQKKKIKEIILEKEKKIEEIRRKIMKQKTLYKEAKEQKEKEKMNLCKQKVRKLREEASDLQRKIKQILEESKTDSEKRREKEIFMKKKLKSFLDLLKKTDKKNMKMIKSPREVKGKKDKWPYKEHGYLPVTKYYGYTFCINPTGGSAIEIRFQKKDRKFVGLQFATCEDSSIHDGKAGTWISYGSSLNKEDLKKNKNIVSLIITNLEKKFPELKKSPNKEFFEDALKLK